MKVGVFDLSGKRKKEIDLPAVFETPIRPDLIARVNNSTQSVQKQPQGRDPLAGKRTTAESWGTGRGMARVPRVKGGGTKAANSGAFVSMTVGGHLAHPPRSSKVLARKVNKAERKLALKSAIAATKEKELVVRHGHKIGQIEMPLIVVDDKIQTIKKTSTLVEVLELLGLKDELSRIKEKKIRAGKGKKRGRRYRKKKGPLIISENFGIYKAAKNLPGIDVVPLNGLSVDKLAPGGKAGRLTIWSESSLRALEQWT